MTTKRFAKIAMVAALYAAVSLALAPMSYGPIQVRIAEALTMLARIWQPAIPALTLGCFITNLIGTAMSVTGPIDIVVGTLATFLAAVCTWKLRNKLTAGIPLAAILMPVLFNGVFVGIELAWMLNPDQIARMSVVYGFQVAVGELISVIIGYLVVRNLPVEKLFKE
jgi:uncharacterized membrane protein